MSLDMLTNRTGGVLSHPLLVRGVGRCKHVFCPFSYSNSKLGSY